MKQENILEQQNSKNILQGSFWNKEGGVLIDCSMNKKELRIPLLIG